MNWSTMITIALSIWGILFPGISVRDESNNPAYIYVTSQAWADNLTQAPNCIISVLPRNMIGFSDSTVQNVITHEVGHCLGLEHISQPGLMYPDASQYPFSGYDRSEFWHHYPAPNQYILTNLGADH